MARAEQLRCEPCRAACHACAAAQVPCPAQLAFQAALHRPLCACLPPQDAHNLLRPESVESFYLLWKASGDPQYKEWAWQVGGQAPCQPRRWPCAHACMQPCMHAAMLRWLNTPYHRPQHAAAVCRPPHFNTPTAGVPSLGKVDPCGCQHAAQGLCRVPGPAGPRRSRGSPGLRPGRRRRRGGGGGGARPAARRRLPCLQHQRRLQQPGVGPRGAPQTP